MTDFMVFRKPNSLLTRISGQSRLGEGEHGEGDTRGDQGERDRRRRSLQTCSFTTCSSFDSDPRSNSNPLHPTSESL